MGNDLRNQGVAASSGSRSAALRVETAKQAQAKPAATNAGAITPGPWMAASHPSSVVGWPIVASSTRVVANVHWVHGHPERHREAAANANLIAAAPDLFEALEIMVAEQVDYMRLNNLGDPEKQQTIKMARAALAKSRGEMA